MMDLLQSKSEKIKTNYDVVILGAGMAGLLLASELSRYFSILIVEKKDRIPINKYWLTDGDALENNTELIHLIDIHYSSMDFITYKGFKHNCKGNYCLWNSNNIVQYLVNKIESNSGKIITSSTFYSYKRVETHINACINDRIINSKLLIDCMGFSSPLIYSKRIIDIIGYYILYGETVELKQTINPICLDNVVINKKPKYLEVFPFRNLAHIALLTPLRHMSQKTNIKEEFEFIKNKTKYKNYFKSLTKPDILYGTVPVGILKKNALDNIFFYGEAGQVNPGATGTCFTKMLKNYKKVSRMLKACIDGNNLQANDISLSLPYKERFNRNFQTSLFNEILNWNSDNFNKAILKISRLDNKIANEILFGELDPTKIIQYSKLFFKNNLFFLSKPISKSLFV